eukprot:7383781-Prymnesium_polylepis.2
MVGIAQVARFPACGRAGAWRARLAFVIGAEHAPSLTATAAIGKLDKIVRADGQYTQRRPDRQIVECQCESGLMIRTWYCPPAVCATGAVTRMP